MKSTVYIETTIFSYLTARLSADLIVAGHQKITELWWEERRENFECVISQIVLNEIARGDAQAAQRRIEKAFGISLLKVNHVAEDLSARLVEEGALPRKAAIDALHISIAAIHQIDFLLTWNCTHIANAQMRPKIENIIRAAGFKPPIIATPEEL
jgi:predicted nucleic acid-binding protein